MYEENIDVTMMVTTKGTAFIPSSASSEQKRGWDKKMGYSELE